jgi:carbohydrate diacid regulator
LNQVLPSSQFGKLVGQRGGEIVVIAGCDQPVAAALAKHLTRHGFSRKGSVDVGASIGVGLDKNDVAYLPEALVEARLALELTGPGKPMLRFADVDLAQFLARRADRAALRLIPEWLRQAHENGTERDLLLTIRTFAECSLNVKETARQLGVHTNTVYFRLNQIKARANVDARTFGGSMLLVSSLLLLESHRGNSGGQE